MPKVTRLYEVEDLVDPNKVHLVEAASQASARSHVADKYVGQATIAAPKRIAELMGAGVKPEQAKGGE